MRGLAVLLLGLCFRPVIAQSSGRSDAATMLSPQAAYDQASAPVDITHRDMGNWSEVEISSLTVAVAKAKDACLQRASITFAGDDLIAYARLCALGKQWTNTLTAATNYIGSKDAEKPQLALAYAFDVQAHLNLKQPKEANRECFAMMRAVPYGPIPDAVTDSTVRYLQFAYLDDALDLLVQRQPLLLAMLRAFGTAPADADAVPLHTLFEHALELAALQQYNVQPERAAEALAKVDQAMPANLPPDEAILIDAARRQYALLGTHFPDLTGAVPLLSATAPRRVSYGAAAVFLLFPPWCAQCVRQSHDIAEAALRRADKGAHLYGLLADDPPAPMPSPARTGARSTAGGRVARQDLSRAVEAPERVEAPKSAAEQLRGTPTLVVAPATLAEFNATDFPFLIATDHDGIIRLMVSAVSDNALVKDGPIDQVVDTILENWPAPAGKP